MYWGQTNIFVFLDRPLPMTYSLYCCNILPMPRRTRHIFIDIPHHLTQRGNYRQSVFCTDDDYLSYLELLWQYSLLYRVKIWA